MLKNGECSVETVVVSNFKVDYYGKRLREAEATAELDGENVKIIWDDTTFSFYEGKSSEPFNEGVYDRDKFKWIEKQITSDKICLRVAQVEWEDKNTLIFLSVVDGWPVFSRKSSLICAFSIDFFDFLCYNIDCKRGCKGFDGENNPG